MAFLNPRMRDYETEFLKKKIKLLIVEVHDWTNKPIDEGNVEDTIDDFVKELKSYATTLTLVELRLCFRNGSIMKYGEYFGLNVATYWNWIGKFQTDEDRNKVRRIVEKRSLVDEKPTLSEEQKEQIVVDGIVKQFEQFKEGGRGMLTTVSYDYLKRIGLINYTDEQQNRIREIARKELTEELVANKGAKSMATALSELRGNVLINACKKRGLFEYFDGLKAMELNLEEIIKEAKEAKNGHE